MRGPRGALAGSSAQLTGEREALRLRPSSGAPNAGGSCEDHASCSRNHSARDKCECFLEQELLEIREDLIKSILWGDFPAPVLLLCRPRI